MIKNRRLLKCATDAQLATFQQFSSVHSDWMFTFRRINISNMVVEVCANSLQSALNAERAGAHRIELCSELGVGGITPSYGLLKMVRESLSIPIHVLIRPRSGDFTYSDQEFNIMKEDIRQCVEMGFDGIVAGILHKDCSLDVERTKQLVSLSGKLHFTFHRAFDWVSNPISTLKQLETMGVHCILTSGQQLTAAAGMPLLRELLKEASNCIIMPGSGIREQTAIAFKKLGFKAIHLSAAIPHKTLAAVPAVTMNSPSMVADDHVFLSDPVSIENVVKSVK